VLALSSLRGGAQSGADVRTVRGLAAVQIVSGVLAAAFIVYHVVQVHALERGPHQDAFAAYGALLAALGRPWIFVAYVVGVTAVCFHAAFGAARFTSGTPQGSRGMRLLFGTLALLLWALWLQPLARLATGAALF
jgi:succinate dehydrogenase hydrophobic anchor subunit